MVVDFEIRFKDFVQFLYFPFKCETNLRKNFIYNSLKIKGVR